MEFKLFTSMLFGDDRLFAELFVCWALTKDEAQLRHFQRSSVEESTFTGSRECTEGIDEKTLAVYLKEDIILDLREDSMNQDFSFLLSLRT